MIELTDGTFNEFVKSSTKLVLVDFWAPWCNPCVKLSPVIEELSTEFSDSVDFVKVNVDENMQTAKDFDVMSIPTLLIFHNGIFQGKINPGGNISSLRERISASVELFK